MDTCAHGWLGRERYDGGGGIFLQQRNGEAITKSITTGKFSSNYRAETEAIRSAAAIAMEHREKTHNHILILTDALSVVTALKTRKNSEMDEVRAALSKLTLAYGTAVIQWIPSYCDVLGNEVAD